MEMYDKENLISALSDEFVRTVAKNGEFTVTIVDVSAERLLRGLRDKMYDGILIPVTEKPPLSMRDLVFSQSYFALGPVLVFETQTPNLTPETILAKRVGITQGSTILTHLYRYPNLDVQIHRDHYAGLESLTNGHVDALIIDALPAFLQLESRYKGIFRIQSPTLTKGGIKLVTLDSNRGDELIETFNSTLKESFNDGGYQNLLNRWGFTGYPQPLFKTIKQETAEEEDDL
jgi:ABC-type amino acid transport substrate-binding protein